MTLGKPDLVELADVLRKEAFAELSPESRAEKGQFGTPAAVARRMADLLEPDGRETVRVLDAGAGVGTLTAAVVERLLAERRRPAFIQITAVEVDPRLAPALERTLGRCHGRCAALGVKLEARVLRDDFISLACDSRSTSEFGRFDVVIQNPPYHKLRSNSAHRLKLRSVGIEVSNLYAAFVALGARLLDREGDLVAITPRSFCNGTYFRAFRTYLLARVDLCALHVFDSRKLTFAEDAVLQESVIMAARARGDAPSDGDVRIYSSSGTPGDEGRVMMVPKSEVILERDAVIRLIVDEDGLEVARRMKGYTFDLAALSVSVSTGRVVDFRATSLLRDHPGRTRFPLIYPLHLRAGRVTWPVRGAKRPNALADGEGVEALLVPPGIYVLVKRFSAKEQRRRIEATVFDSDTVAPGRRVGFENHLNYLHVDGGGLDAELAAGLAGWLNSTLVDRYFRLFSGHTQVNASDLRALPYPSERQLRALGRRLGRAVEQEVVDVALEEELFASRGAR